MGRRMRLAVLGEPAGWHVGRLLETAEKRGHTAKVIRWRDLATSLGGGTPQDRDAGLPEERFLPAAIDEADAVIVRGMPTGGLEEVVFRMNLLARLAARGTRVVNPPRSLEIAIDKHLSLAMLAAAGIPVPRSHVAQTPAAVLAAWHDLGRDAVAKPLFGSQGKGVERLGDAMAVERYVALRQEGSVAYLQEFVPHAGWDARLFVLGDDLFAMKRVSTTDWRTNIALGGKAEPFEPPRPWVDLARRAALVIGAPIAGVDLVERPGGGVSVLEVNAVPGWRALESVNRGPIAPRVMAFLEEAA